ncbi:MAG: hypothetical protein ACXWV2_03035, partial [Chitinophagaceae bacterium]
DKIHNRSRKKYNDSKKDSPPVPQDYMQQIFLRQFFTLLECRIVIFTCIYFISCVYTLLSDHSSGVEQERSSPKN